jgi:ABC-type multidrug transport system permease subunit
MNRPEQNDPLDALLREQNQYVEDNGFTRRVVSALPRRPSRFPLCQIFLLVVTTIGSALAISQLPLENLPLLNLSALITLNSQVLLPWALALSVIASLVWATVVAVQWED